jgi:phage-related protein
MPTVIWPTALPQAQNEGCQYWTDSGVVRTAMEAGPDKVVRRAARARRFFSTPMELTGAGLAVFEDFLATVHGGADAFEWTHPVTDAAVECRLTQEPRWNLKIGAEPALRRWTSAIEVEIVADIDAPVPPDDPPDGSEWPAALPDAQNEDTQYWTDSNLVRTPFPAAIANVRQRSTNVRRFFSTPMELTGAQLVVFEAFLAATAGGTTPFNWTHPATDAAVLCRLTKEPRWALKIGADPELRRWTSDIEVELLRFSLN